MKFGNLFEFHKIPEWYYKYLNYKQLCTLIESHQQSVKQNRHAKLNGVFFITESMQVLDVPIFT